MKQIYEDLENLERVNALIGFYRSQERNGIERGSRDPKTTIERVAFIRQKMLPTLTKLRDALEQRICAMCETANG